MFLKVILIIICIGIIVDIFISIKDNINSYENFLNKFTDLQKEHNEINSYLKDNNREIKSILYKYEHIKEDINYIKNSIKEDQYKKEYLSKKEVDINKIIEHFEILELKNDNKFLKDKIENLNSKIESLKIENNQLNNTLYNKYKYKWKDKK